VESIPEKIVYDFRKNTSNYRLLQDKSLMGNFDGFAFDFEQRCDSIIEEGDLARLQKEFDRNYKK
jgi:hypothetical protein